MIRLRLEEDQDSTAMVGKEVKPEVAAKVQMAAYSEVQLAEEERVASSLREARIWASAVMG
jgi:hypothetical protein